MTKCEHFDQCVAFFLEQAKKLPATTHFMKSTYCQVGNHHCARFMVFMARGSENVPMDLFPCQHVRGQLLAR